MKNEIEYDDVDLNTMYSWFGTNTFDTFDNCNACLFKEPFDGTMGETLVSIKSTSMWLLFPLVSYPTYCVLNVSYETLSEKVERTWANNTLSKPNS